MRFGISYAPHRIDAVHQTLAGKVNQQAYQEFDTPEEAREGLTRMYREYDAEVLGVSEDTELVWMNLYENGVLTDQRIAEF
jgi:hypothetical protein